MARERTSRETVPGFLRDLDVRLTRLERHTHTGGGGGGGGTAPTPSVSEVEISTLDPWSRNQQAELWFDPDAPSPPSGGGAQVSEVEVSVQEPTNTAAELWFNPAASTTPFQSINEVWIGTAPPTDTNVELWFDPDATLP